jgi:hypothetical protein
MKKSLLSIIFTGAFYISSIAQNSFLTIMDDTVNVSAVQHLMLKEPGLLLATGTYRRTITDAARNFIMEMDDNGNVIWKRFYFTVSAQALYSSYSRDHNILYSSNMSPASTALECFGSLRAYDSLGVRLWSKDYSCFDFNYFTFVSQADSFLYAAGRIYPYTVSPNNAFTPVFLKLDTSGHILHAHEYRPDSVTSMRDSKITRLLNGDYLICGEISDSTSTTLGSFALRVDTSGTLLWAKKFDLISETGNLRLRGVTEDISSNLYFSYIRVNASTVINCSYLTKTDNAGNIIWNKGIAVQNVPAIGYLSTDLSGTIINFAGYYSQGGQQNALAIRLDTSGSVISERAYHSNGSYFFSGALDPGNGGVYYYGFIDNFINGTDNGVIQKNDSVASTISCNEIQPGVVISPRVIQNSDLVLQTNLISCTETLHTDTMLLHSIGDITICSFPTAINEIADIDFTIYPNPAANQITIQFENSTSTECTLTLFNSTGTKCLSQELKSKTVIDVSQFSAGFYIAGIYDHKSHALSFRKIIIKRD